MASNDGGDFLVGAGRGRRLRFEPLEDRRLLATLTVNTLVDESNGINVGGVSLREAVAAAGAGDTINFSVTGTISLLNNAGTPGHILIDKGLTIQGPGATLLTIKAYDPDPGGTNNSNGRRAFVVNDNNAGTLANVTISGLTLTNADPVVVDEFDGGSAILNRENLTLNACVLSGNYSPNGGSIYSTAGALSINDCTISDNSAGDGGGVLIASGSLAIARSKIINNVANNSGGGILARGVPVTIVDSTISGNSTDEYGGGVYIYQSSLNMSGTTISNNAADNNHDLLGSGGGIYNIGGSLAIMNSTISGNSSAEGGGGIYSNTGQTTTIAHSTLTGNTVPNTAGTYGGGIKSFGAWTLDHTIVAGNLRGAAIRDDLKGVFSATHSLIGDKRDATVNDLGGSLIGTTAVPINAKLATLANNGGPTLTHALLTGSPAIEAGALAVAGTNGIPTFDQRGTPFSRVVDFDSAGGARLDIGAVEMAAVPTGPALLGDYNLNHVVDAGDYVLWRKTSGTSVAQAYDGADGDGNLSINGTDYTVWRSHFGNLPSASGAAFDAPIEAQSNSSVAAVEGADTTRPQIQMGAIIVPNDNSSVIPRKRCLTEVRGVTVDAALELLMTSSGSEVDDSVENTYQAAVVGDATVVHAATVDEFADGLVGEWEAVSIPLHAPRY